MNAQEPITERLRGGAELFGTAPRVSTIMKLRRLLTAIGLQGNAVETEGDPFLRRLHDQLQRMGPERLEYLAGFAGQLARVAHADDEISAAEAAVIKERLTAHAGLTAAEAGVVLDLLRHEFEVLRSVQNHLLNRAINAHASQADKETLIDCLYAVAAAEHLVSDIEEREIRRIADAVLISHRALIEIRSRYRDHLEVLQGFNRKRQ